MSSRRAPITFCACLGGGLPPRRRRLTSAKQDSGRRRDGNTSRHAGAARSARAAGSDTMSRRPVLCDRCGTPIERIEDGWVQWTRDGLGVVTALTLVHQAERCMYDQEIETAAIEDHHASAFLAARHVAYLKNLPRYLEGTSVSRVLGKVRRLAAGAPAGTA